MTCTNYHMITCTQFFVNSLSVQRHCTNYWATACKTVRPMLSDRFLSVLSVCLLFCLSCPVCDVGVLWPDGWTDQDETWHACRPRSWPYCVIWGPRSPSQGGTAPPQFSAHICCGQMARLTKMPIGRKVGLDQSSSLSKKEAQPRNFRPMFIVPKRLDGSRCHLVRW